MPKDCHEIEVWDEVNGNPKGKFLGKPKFPVKFLSGVDELWVCGVITEEMERGLRHY